MIQKRRNDGIVNTQYSDFDSQMADAGETELVKDVSTEPQNNGSCSVETIQNDPDDDISF